MLCNSIDIYLTCHRGSVDSVDNSTGPSKLFDWLSAVIFSLLAVFNIPLF